MEHTGLKVCKITKITLPFGNVFRTFDFFLLDVQGSHLQSWINFALNFLKDPAAVVGVNFENKANIWLFKN